MPPFPVELPTNFYLSLRFNRGNCGTVVGTPAQVGFSGDIWDFPSFPCNAFLGGFPNLPHASFWAEFYGDSSCEEAHLAYKSARASGGVAALGPNVQGLDDVQLQAHDCRMKSYEVVVKKAGRYTFDLRRQCDGQVIPGTERSFDIPEGATPELQAARFDFDPPIDLPGKFYLGFRCDTATCGAVIAGIQPAVGTSDAEYLTLGPNGCNPIYPSQGVHGAVNFSVVCDGPAQLGACCDDTVTLCNAGPDAGKYCPANRICIGGPDAGKSCSPSVPCSSPGVCPNYCAAPGTCESGCHEVPEINCFHVRQYSYSPPDTWENWLEGAACDPNPFPHACGLFACCKPDDTCENLTKNECDAVEPLERVRFWNSHKFCYEGDQICPYNACLARQGECLAVHPTPGCKDPFCCSDVCDFDPWCCQVDWDESCLRWADSMCAGSPPNDQCASDFPIHGLSGALAVPVPGVLFGTNSAATVSPAEPGFCCHSGIGICTRGFFEGELCVSSNDCGGFECAGIEPMPGDRANGTVWHKFVATSTTARISTCGSQHLDSRFANSLVQVFAAQDESTPLSTCSSLSPVACNDDAGTACPDEPGNSQLCIGGLTPGKTYYVLVGSKLEQYRGRYRLEISAPCVPPPAVAGDSCFDSLAVTDGATPFTTAGATFDCPPEICTPNARNDLWFAYTATCTGEAAFSTCGDNDPDTNVVVYDGCAECPNGLSTSVPVGCNGNADLLDCRMASMVAGVPVRKDHCYKIRVADENGVPVSGDLHITCQSVGCPEGIVSLVSPPNHVVDARRPSIPGIPLVLEGIDSFHVVGSFYSAEPECWSLCETNTNSSLHPPYSPELLQNAIIEAVEDPPAVYHFRLKRPITPGETTILWYTDNSGNVTSLAAISQPGDVDGNRVPLPSDILRLIDVINGVQVAAWAEYSTDCDHSGATSPADILCIIDLLNAGWNGTSQPLFEGECP